MLWKGAVGGRQLGMSTVSLLTKALSLELSTVLASDLIWHSLAGHISPDACLPGLSCPEPLPKPIALTPAASPRTFRHT